MTITSETLKHAAIGAVVTVLITLGAALVGLGQTANLTEWARNLGIAESGALGAYIVNTLRGFIPSSTPDTASVGK